jgi:hypothetical protein
MAILRNSTKFRAVFRSRILEASSPNVTSSTNAGYFQCDVHPVNGHTTWMRITQPLPDPLGKTAFKRFWINQGEDSTKSILRGNALFEAQKASQPDFFISGIQGNFQHQQLRHKS